MPGFGRARGRPGELCTGMFVGMGRGPWPRIIINPTCGSFCVFFGGGGMRALSCDHRHTKL